MGLIQLAQAWSRTHAILLCVVICTTGAWDGEYVSDDIDFILRWNVSTSKLVFQVVAPTSGWVGIGFNGHGGGGMKGADIMICSASAGASAVDYYSLAYQRPRRDLQQDWKLLSSSWQNSRTECVVERALNTSDDQDWAVDFDDLAIGPISMIMAYGFPRNGITAELSYHAARIAAQVQLRGSTAGSAYERLRNMSDYGYSDTITRNFEIPAYSSQEFNAETYYSLDCYNLNVSQQFSSTIIGITTTVASPLVHHMLGVGFSSEGCNSSPYDYGVVYTWVKGTNAIEFDSSMGLPGGGTDGIRSILLNVHYDNPQHIEGVVDVTSISIHLTPQGVVRPISVGTIQLADPTVQLATGTNSVLPLGWSKFTWSAEIDQSSPQLNLFAAIHHMHDKGEVFSTTLRRSNSIIQVMTTEYYDWRFQMYNPINWTVLPGDVLVTSCAFNAQISQLKFGFNSDDEMCIDFLYYYPRQPSSIVSRSFVSREQLSGPHESGRNFGMGHLRTCSSTEISRCEINGCCSRNRGTRPLA